MSLVSNVRVYGLPESIFASGYAMREEPPTEEKFNQEVMALMDMMDLEDCAGGRRAVNLADTPIGSGHDQYETGIIVQFDLNFTIKAWTEAERYTFLNFISSNGRLRQ